MEKNRKQSEKMLPRVLAYILGLFFLAIAVRLSLNSNLGISPVNSFPYAISVASGISMGNCVTGVFVSYVLVQILLLRREFELKNLLQVVFSTLFGYFVDVAAVLVGDFTLPTYFGKLGMLALSILCVTVGLTLYLTADIVPLPSEGMTLALTKKIGRFPFHNMKIALDCSYVLMAAVILFLATGSISGIREGTVIAAVVTGKVLPLVAKPLRPILKKLLGREMPA